MPISERCFSIGSLDLERKNSIVNAEKLASLVNACDETSLISFFSKKIFYGRHRTHKTAFLCGFSPQFPPFQAIWAQYAPSPQ